MPDPRTALFQRKGPPMMDEGAPPPVFDKAPGSAGGDDPQTEGSAMVCPNCQCEFDPVSGEIIGGGEGAMPDATGGGDLAAQIEGMMGGGMGGGGAV